SWHAGLHRYSQSGQSFRLRAARRRLAHRLHHHQGHARGHDQSSGHRNALRESGKRCDRHPRAQPHRCAAHAPRARSRRPLWRPVDGGQGCGPGGCGRQKFPRRTHCGISRRASAHLRLQLFRRAESRAGQFLCLGLWADRAAEDAAAGAAGRCRPGAQIDAPRLFRRRLARHADLRSRLARATPSAARPGGRGGVWFDHRHLPATRAGRRCARDPDHPSNPDDIRRHGMSLRPVATQRASSAPLSAQSVDPIVLQIVEGTLSSIEAEIEYAIERTARSPMIREAHDYRVGVFDRRCRKLTGRSYSAMPNAVVRDFALTTMRPGDVYLMNDTYLSEGSIGHLPDLCSTVPVFHAGEVVAFIQAFGHHDDIGGRVPGSMPGTANTVFEEGLAIPPIKLYDAGERNDAVITIIKRNSRVPEMLAADLDSEVKACVMGARRLEGLFARFGRETVELCFQAILDKCRDIYRNELIPKIADGEYSW